MRKISDMPGLPIRRGNASPGRGRGARRGRSGACLVARRRREGPPRERDDVAGGDRLCTICTHGTHAPAISI